MFSVDQIVVPTGQTSPRYVIRAIVNQYYLVLDLTNGGMSYISQTGYSLANGSSVPVRAGNGGCLMACLMIPIALIRGW